MESTYCGLQLFYDLPNYNASCLASEKYGFQNVLSKTIIEGGWSNKSEKIKFKVCSVYLVQILIYLIKIVSLYSIVSASDQNTVPRICGALYSAATVSSTFPSTNLSSGSSKY